MPKHVWEKCGKLCIFSILSSKRGITPTFQLNVSKHVGEKIGKVWLTDGDPDRRTSPYHNASRLKTEISVDYLTMEKGRSSNSPLKAQYKKYFWLSNMSLYEGHPKISESCWISREPWHMAYWNLTCLWNSPIHTFDTKMNAIAWRHTVWRHSYWRHILDSVRGSKV